MDKRNLKIRETASAANHERWKTSERKRTEKIVTWEDDQVQKEMERYTLWRSGALYGKNRHLCDPNWNPGRERRALLTESRVLGADTIRSTNLFLPIMSSEYWVDVPEQHL